MDPPNTTPCVESTTRRVESTKSSVESTESSVESIKPIVGSTFIIEAQILVVIVGGGVVLVVVIVITVAVVCRITKKCMRVGIFILRFLLRILTLPLQQDVKSKNQSAVPCSY